MADDNTFRSYRSHDPRRRAPEPARASAQPPRSSGQPSRPSGQVGASEARVLRLHLLQIGLSDGKPGQVNTAQVSSEQPEQVDQIAGPISLFDPRPPA